MRDTRLKAQKFLKLKELKKLRDQEINAPIDGVQVGTPEDRENIQGVIRKWDTLGNPTDIKWTLKDNKDKKLSKNNLIAIEDAYIIRKVTIFGKYQNLKDQIDSALNSEELSLISW